MNKFFRGIVVILIFFLNSVLYSYASIPDGITECDETCMEEVYVYAFFSQAAYEYTDLTFLKDWYQYMGITDLGDGLQATIFINKNLKKIAVSFAGTNGFDDVVVDIIQQFKHLPNQYMTATIAADVFIRQFKTTPGLEDYELIFTGHSLGGGIAQIVAYIFNLKAYTFNPAPISSKVLEFYTMLDNLYLELELYKGVTDILNIVALDENGTTFGVISYDAVSSLWGTLLGTSKYLQIPNIQIDAPLTADIFSATDPDPNNVVWSTIFKSDYLALHSIDNIVNKLNEVGLPTVEKIFNQHSPTDPEGKKGKAGDIMSFTGINFGREEGSVFFGTQTAEIISWNPERVTAFVPPAPQDNSINNGEVDLYLQKPSGTLSNINKFLYNTAPKANFEFTSGCNKTVSFTAYSTDEDGSILSWYYHFGDESGETFDTPDNHTHTYENFGSYEVHLTVTDENDESSTITKTVDVQPSILPTPKLMINWQSENRTFQEGDPVTVQIGLEARSCVNESADWWIFANIAGSFFNYDLSVPFFNDKVIV